MWPTRCSDTSRMRVRPVHARRGFTLVEITIVVAIVGVMAGLAAAQLQRQRSNSYFRSSVRDLVGLIREARSNAQLLGSGLSTPGSVLNSAVAPCPGEMLPGNPPLASPNFVPGVVIDTATDQVILLDRVTITPAVAGVCAAGRCAVNNAACAVPGDCPPFPQYTIACRVENFRNIYRNEIDILPGGIPAIVPGATATFAANGGRALITFNGRGMMVTRVGGQPVGRVTIQENAALVSSPKALSVIVSDGGNVCIEGAQDQCARVL